MRVIRGLSWASGNEPVRQDWIRVITKIKNDQLEPTRKLKPYDRSNYFMNPRSKVLLVLEETWLYKPEEQTRDL